MSLTNGNGLTKTGKDILNGIASKNNNKSVNDSEVKRHYANVTADEMKNTPAGDGSGKSEFDLMMDNFHSDMDKRTQNRSELFNSIVNYYSLPKEEQGAAYTKIEDLQNSLKRSELKDGKYVELTGLGGRAKSDAHALGRYGDIFTRDGDSAKWSGKFTGDDMKDLKLAKTIFGRQGYKGTHWTDPRSDNYKAMGGDQRSEGVKYLVDKIYAGGGQKIGNQNLRSIIQNYKNIYNKD